MIALTSLPGRVQLPTEGHVTVEHNGISVGNIRYEGREVVAYHHASDALGGDGTIAGALSWLRDRARQTWPNADIPDPVEVTESGLYDLPAAIYHGDPVPAGSLSFSRAKKLLEEAGPAKFHHAESVPPETRAEFDLGTAAHALVLGKGAERLVQVDAESWRTKAAQAAREKAYTEGKTPLLPGHMRQAEDMAEALSRNHLAVETLTGKPEVSMFWEHESGLWLRGQMDIMADGWTADYKTTIDASGAGFTKAAWKYRYHMQAAWYRRLRGWLTGDWLPYRLVAQEKAAPHLVSVWELPDDYLALGVADMDDAIELYLQCSRTGQWPGYPTEVQPLSPPDWAIDDDIQIGA